mmetsp:Transcript_18574/g.70488  ORF Transcript_18574/g.70488 Transcript_18574/m.70488 type:complete len:318 (+) Transcript_18574:995-1948(+)
MDAATGAGCAADVAGAWVAGEAPRGCLRCDGTLRGREAWLGVAAAAVAVEGSVDAAEGEADAASRSMKGAPAVWPREAEELVPLMRRERPLSARAWRMWPRAEARGIGAVGALAWLAWPAWDEGGGEGAGLLWSSSSVGEGGAARDAELWAGEAGPGRWVGIGLVRQRGRRPAGRGLSDCAKAGATVTAWLSEEASEPPLWGCKAIRPGVTAEVADVADVRRPVAAAVPDGDRKIAPSPEEEEDMEEGPEGEAAADSSTSGTASWYDAPRTGTATGREPIGRGLEEAGGRCRPVGCVRRWGAAGGSASPELEPGAAP